jgi:Flp pilus assembly protein TadG
MSRNERGAAAVEFALVVPLLVLLVAGIASFGRIYFLQTTLSGAAREGVRAMALKNDTSAARTAAKTAAATVTLTDAQIAVSPATGSCLSTASATTTATVTITYSTTYLSRLVGTSVTLKGTGVMRCGG